MCIDKSGILRDLVEKAIQCKTAEELVTLVNANGYEITKEEAEAFIAEMEDFELDHAKLKNISGDSCCIDC